MKPDRDFKTGHFSSHEDGIMRERRAAGDTVEQIAALLGRSPDSCQHRLQRLGVKAPPKSDFWTPERLRELAAHCSNGLSFSEISERFGRAVTRSAVGSAIHRHNIPRPKRKSGGPQNAKRRPALAFAVLKSADPVAKKKRDAERQAVLAKMDHHDGPSPTATTVIDVRDGQCRWPLGDPKSDDFHLCGAPCSSGSAYCEPHSAVAYKPDVREGRDAGPARAGHQAAV